MRKAAAGAIPPPESGFHNFRLHDGVAYSLTNEAAITFNEVVSEILKQKQFSSKFSGKYIEKKLKMLFANLLSKQEYNLEKALVELSTELSRFNQKNIVFLKIDGILLSVCLKIGKVRFVPGDDYLINDINEKNKAIIKTAEINE